MSRSRRSSRLNSSWARRRPKNSRSTVERRREAAWTSMRSRTVPRSARGTDLGADHVVEGKNGAVGGLSGRSPESLLEDVDLALLAGVRIGDEEPAAERIGLDVRGPPSALAEACCE